MQEKQQKIFNAAQETFSELGFKGTNIAKITQRAGVAVGTFYRFYSAKEEIFIQVYAAENNRVKQEVLNANDLNEDPRVLLPKVMRQLMKQATNSLVLQAWYTNPKLKQLIKDDSSVQEDFMYHTVFQLIKRWQQNNLLQPEMTMDRIQQLFEALIVVDNHQDELPSGDFDQLVTDLVQGILDRILK
ncbi:TetR/AcrR family transcriptional regulator [Pediococcus ethanolidurans]|uniref:Transcriptional regulator, TetR family n=1 Tax=Pediococcus ethanolidurans TaxID=319653 RepID=A0A0R2K806_9LACO|nr:TetR/AcrR family transcriptional regulator [Pediococcus ethanolidurans]KRN83340.1 hypothetical protein IV87_GL001375 [Pediococcus ethanolidurans]GEN94521.1 hypothetical protein PET01_05710 [Pediococcus ethanolidurans]SER28361.1 transcriptional regulator, TetR family [Pediococcus ethanolidurans]